MRSFLEKKNGSKENTNENTTKQKILLQNYKTYTNVDYTLNIRGLVLFTTWVI